MISTLGTVIARRCGSLGHGIDVPRASGPVELGGSKNTPIRAGRSPAVAMTAAWTSQPDVHTTLGISHGPRGLPHSHGRSTFSDEQTRARGPAPRAAPRGFQ